MDKLLYSDFVNNITEPWNKLCNIFPGRIEDFHRSTTRQRSKQGKNRIKM